MKEQIKSTKSSLETLLSEPIQPQINLGTGIAWDIMKYIPYLAIFAYSVYKN